MTDAQHETLRHQMSGIADIALACDAKVGNCADLEERVNIIHDHAARIALAALALCPPERLADVAAIWKAMETERAEYKTPKAIQEFLLSNPPLSLPQGFDAVGGTGGWLADLAKAVKPQYNPFMIGPFRIEHVSSKNVSIAKVRIGERVFSCETVDIAGACNVTIFDNGNSVVTMKVQRGKVTSFMIAVKAMKEYIRQLSGNNHKGRRGFLPREIAKMEAAK